MKDWETDERIPAAAEQDQHFDVWIEHGAQKGLHILRTVCRVGYLGGGAFRPGALLFTDCTHRAQNIICDEAAVRGWRLSQP